MLKMRNGFVLIAVEKETDQIEKIGSLYIPTASKKDTEQYHKGTVVSVGKPKTLSLGGDESDLNVGDTVWFDKYSARVYDLDHVIVPEDKIIGIE